MNEPGQADSAVATWAGRRGPWPASMGQALIAFAMAFALVMSVAGVAQAQHQPLQIDCPDAPLYAAGGFSLVRDPQAVGLMLSVRLQHNRTFQTYAITCTTAAAPDATDARPGSAEYDFTCTARTAGHAGEGQRAQMRGAVPAGLGLDHPETRAAIGEAVCPAARLALARHRAATY